jgi:hypothetical protein
MHHRLKELKLIILYSFFHDPKTFDPIFLPKDSPTITIGRELSTLFLKQLKLQNNS